MIEVIEVKGLDELKAAVGQEAVSEWHEVTPGGHQPLRRGDRRRQLDPPRRRAREADALRRDDRARVLRAVARADVQLRLFKADGFALGVNYGVNKVRFPAPMPVGDRVRMRLRLASVDDVPGGAQIVTELTFERDGASKPVCVAESLSRVYVAPDA